MKKSQVKHKLSDVEKENLCSKQCTKTVTTQSSYQRPERRKRSLSVDLEDRRNKLASSIKKTPFHVHVEQSDNKISSVQKQNTFRRYETRNFSDSKRNTRTTAKIEEIKSRHYPHLATSSAIKPKCLPRSNIPRSNESKSVVPKPTAVGNKSTVRPIVSAAKFDLNKRLPISNLKAPTEKSQKTASRSESTKSNSQRYFTRSKSCSSNTIFPSPTINPVCTKFRSELNINLCGSQSRKQTKSSKFNGVTLIKSNNNANTVKKNPVASTLFAKSEIPNGARITADRNKSTKHCSNVFQTSPSKPLAISVNKEAPKTKENICHQNKHPSNIDFSPDLAYHTEYLVDLLNIEAQKEKNAPKLSTNFLDKYINCKQREILVAYLLRISSHCQYPSFLLYQAVKLLDIVIDRIPVEIEDMQLTTLAVLWIILKKDGTSQKIPSGNKMIALAKDFYNGKVALLAKCERLILGTLKFNITFPDPFSIFVYYVINCNCIVDFPDGIITTIYYCGGYTIDLSLLDVNFCYKSSHLLAVTVAELVLCILLDLDCYLLCPRWTFWREAMMFGVNSSERFDSNDIDVLRATLIGHVIKSSRKYSTTEVVFKKYDRSRYGKVSELFVEKIKKLSMTESILL